MTHWFDKMDYHLNWLHNCELWDEIIQRSRYNHVFKLIELLVHKYIKHSLRVSLSREYKEKNGELLVDQDDDEVKMTFENYKAIFGLYFAFLGLPLLVCLYEIMCTLGGMCKKRFCCQHIRFGICRGGTCRELFKH